MRRVLVDYARQRGRIKREGQWQRVSLADGLGATHDLDLEGLMDLNAALDKLAALDERQAAGDWAHARAWLSRELDSAGAG